MSLELEQLLANGRIDERRISEQGAELRDALLQIGVLVLDALALETREGAQTEVEDRLRLDLGELEALHQRRTRGIRVIRGPDERDDLVEVVERDEVALEHVRTLERACAARTSSGA